MSPRPVQPAASAALALGPGRKISSTLALYDGANRLYSQGKELWRKHLAYTVSVTERDPLYADVHAWLLTIMPSDRHRALLVSSSYASRFEPMEASEPSDGEPRKASPLKIRFDDSSRRKVYISGHQVTVQLSRPEVPAESSKSYEIEPKKIEFVCNTYSAQQAVLEELEKINSEKFTTRRATLRMVNSWGSWRVRSDIPPRSLQSVSLPGDQMDRIVKDLRDFLNSEDRYNRLAIPWHRGYMFHGPPGTGKTSLVKALASHFNLDLWYISLSDLTAEAGLLGLLSEVGPRSILLLEDIDTVKITHDRDSSEQGKISTSSLLNTLDGVATPHGLITMMTTNRFDVLDDALTRAGRMDVIEELGYPTKETIGKLFYHFYGERPTWATASDRDIPIEGLSTARVSEIFKQHLSDADAANKAVLRLLLNSSERV